MLNDQDWPALPLAEWEDTRATLHMWTQIVGKVRMKLSPHANHWWEVPLYVTARGLTTSPIPYGDEIFEVNFDFIAHKLQIQTSRGTSAEMLLRPCSVAEFYSEFMGILHDLGINVQIRTMPNEILNGIPFEKDHTHASYDHDFVNRFWRILVSTDTILKEFSAGFIGKVSPVQFFWARWILLCRGSLAGELLSALVPISFKQKVIPTKLVVQVFGQERAQVLMQYFIPIWRRFQMASRKVRFAHHRQLFQLSWVNIC